MRQSNLETVSHVSRSIVTCSFDVSKLYVFPILIQCLEWGTFVDFRSLMVAMVTSSPDNTDRGVTVGEGPPPPLPVSFEPKTSEKSVIIGKKVMLRPSTIFHMVKRCSMSHFSSCITYCYHQASTQHPLVFRLNYSVMLFKGHVNARANGRFVFHSDAEVVWLVRRFNFQKTNHNIKMIRLFEDGAHSGIYKKFRPRTPQIAVSKVMNYLEEKLSPPHDFAVDVGCGSGQNTVVFAPYFKKVVGCDVSSAQIEVALMDPAVPPNVSYQVAAGESLKFPDNSVELITGCLSFHWLDLTQFYKEVDRVLVPNGVVAALGHILRHVSHPTKSAELNELINSLVKDNLETKMHPNVSVALNDYKELPLPYKDEVRLQNLTEEIEKTVADVTGTFASWSCFQAIYAENPQKASSILENFQKEFLNIMGVDTPAEATPIVVKHEYFLAMCRKPAK